MQSEAALLTDPRLGALVPHYLEVSQEFVSRFMGKPRRRRSFDWIGSLRKWIAGFPDASDWNAIIRTPEKVVKSADQQVRINAGLLKASHESLKQLNEVTARVNAQGSDHQQSGQQIDPSLFVS